MAELLLAGVTHYPPLSLRDQDMAGILLGFLADPAIPAEAKDPSRWPQAMQAEWGQDEARASAELEGRPAALQFEKAAAVIVEARKAGKYKSTLSI